MSNRGARARARARGSRGGEGEEEREQYLYFPVCGCGWGGRGDLGGVFPGSDMDNPVLVLLVLLEKSNGGLNVIKGVEFS